MRITDSESLRKLWSVFSVVAEANGFVHIEGSLFRDVHGRKYFLDTLGFHTVSQYSNAQLAEREADLALELSKCRRILSSESLGDKSRSKILNILEREHLLSESKCARIWNYLNSTTPEELTD